jgi:hypothetical protein
MIVHFQAKESAVRESLGLFDADVDAGRYRTAFYLMDLVSQMFN